MNHKPWLQTAMYLALVLPACMTYAQSPASEWRLTGIEGAGSPRVTLSPSSDQALVFLSTAVGGTAQQLTATFDVTASSSLTPTVSTHYGRDYTVNDMKCSANGSGQTCSVSVSFLPTLPGARPDSLFVSNGSQRLATVLLSGTGQSPLALLQGTNKVPTTSQTFNGTAVIDELGTLYFLDKTTATITSITAAGARTALPICDIESARSLALDGAGVLYVLTSANEKVLVTFDTVQGIQAKFALPVAASTIDSIALSATGSLSAYSSSAHILYRISSTGSVTKIALASAQAASSMMMGAGGDLFLGGDSLQKLNAAGVQAQLKVQAAAKLNTDSASANMASPSFTPIAIDAAGTLYAGHANAVFQLPAPDYTALASTLPTALAVATDGSLLSADATSVYHLNRSQAQLDFGSVTPGATTEPEIATVYNGGNLPLSLSNISIEGDGYSIASVPANTCVAGLDVAPGASCQIAIALRASNAAVQSGTVSITSNSLNNVSTTQPLTVIAHPNATSGSQAVFSPTSLSFPSTTVLVASAPLSVTLSNPGTAALNFTSLALTGAGSASYSLTQTCFTALPASLAPGASCTITVIFKPLTAAVQTAAISVGDDLGGVAGSAQTVAITGTGTAAPAPIITATYSTTYTASTLTFGNPPTLTIPLLANVVIVGTTSAAGTITLANTGNATLNISSIGLAITGTSTLLPFTQTNTCGATLAASAKCVVSVVFAPTVAGNTTAALVVADNAIGTPQSFAIAGYPTAGDYNMTSTVTSVTIPSSGGTGQVPLTATPTPAPFPTPIDFTVFGIPAGATYSFSPSSIMAVSTASTSSLNITLPAYHPVTLSQSSPFSPLRKPYVPIAAVALTGLWLGARRRKMPRLTRILQALLLGAMGLGMISLSACSGGYPLASGVAPGTYVLTITAASANGNPSTTTPPFPAATTHTVTVNLVVQ